MNPNDDLDEDHCTICLQPFLDRTIISVCAHEFCFECILLWSEQSRKCPLCARSFDSEYLIHRIRSQFDYQKHYLLPLRSSPPPLTGESRLNALRHTRRERQWGRRQRQQREEADQLERAIARRRWIYQHHLYAKHIASNAYTRYRPFPTPTQFSASPDLISRMTIFLRRELRVWPNLDVEFLTTYTISLMKSIDIRSESAVKLLSEFLDLDCPYTPGARHVNAEHFVHEIYSYLRSPYRDLNMYDQTAQYDNIPPPREIERGNRWSTEPSPSPSRRSRSRSRSYLIPHHDNIERLGRERSPESRREHRASRGQSRRRSLPGQEDPWDGRHNPFSAAQDTLRNEDSHPRERTVPAPLTSLCVAENQNTGASAQHRVPSNQMGKVAEQMNVLGPVTDTHSQTRVFRGDDVAADSEACVTDVLDGPLGTSDDVDVDNVVGGSSANGMPSRKGSGGLDVHPRRRTLSACVQAHLGRPLAGHAIKQGGGQPGRLGADTHGVVTTVTLLDRLTDRPTEGAGKKERTY